MTSSLNALPVVVVTGVSRGIGLSVLQQILRTGKSHVVGVARSMPADLENSLKEFAHQQAQCRFVKGDVSEASVQQLLLEEALSLGGEYGIIGLVNNAALVHLLKSGMMATPAFWNPLPKYPRWISTA